MSDEMHTAIRLVVFLLGLMSAASPTRAAEVEVLHYWISPSESAAVAVLRKEFEARGGQWSDRPVADAQTARRTMISRGVDGIQPAVMHWIGSIEEIKQLVDFGIARPLTDQSSASPGVLPPTIIPRIGRDGVAYLAPLAVHSENWLWFNAEVFAAQGLEPPETWEELVDVAAKLQAAGINPIVSNPGGWEIQVLIRTMISDTYLDEGYFAIWDEDWRKAAVHPAVGKLIDRLVALKPFVHPPTEKGNWDKSTGDLMDGTAAMQFMGDWVKGEFFRRGLEPGKDIGCIRLPGADRLLIVGVDGFLFAPTTEADVRAAQDLFAATVLDPEVQLAFSRVKGSVPARIDIAPDRLDPCARVVWEAMKEDLIAPHGPRLPDHSGLAGPRLFALMTEFLSDPAFDEVAFRSAIDKVIADPTIP